MTIRVSVCLFAIAAAAQAVTLPLFFEPNRGQANPSADFVLRGRGTVCSLNSRQVTFPLHNGAMQMRVVSGRAVRGEALEQLPGKSAYLSLEKNARQLAGIHQFGRVRYAGVYAGVDLTYYNVDGQLEYDFIVQPGASPARIRLAFTGAKPRIDGAGDLILETASGPLRQLKPRAYQESAAGRREIDARYQVHRNGEVGFEIASFNPGLPLVIDPLMEYSTYLLHQGMSTALFALKIDSQGDIYLGGYDSANRASLAKFSPARNQILYSVVVAPGSGSGIYSVDVNAAGEAYAGATIGGTGTVFKLAADGQSILFSQPTTGALPYSVAVDAQGNVFAAGASITSYFQIKNAIQPERKTMSSTGILAKFSPTGELLFSTYWGGSNVGWATAVVLDKLGYPYAVGTTFADDFPVKNGLKQGGRGYNVWATKFSPDGQRVEYSSLFGGARDARGLPGANGASDAAVDAAGNLYMIGNTECVDFPTVRPLQGQSGGANSPFVAVLNAQGNALLYSTYFGGGTSDRLYDVGRSIAVGPGGGIFVAGMSLSPVLPLKNSLIPYRAKIEPPRPPYESAHFGFAFAAKLTSDGSGLIYSTLLGGSGNDGATRVAADASGAAWVIGTTTSADFPVTANAVQSTGVAEAAFLVKLADNSPTGPPLSGGNQPPVSSLVASPSVLRFAAATGQAAAPQTVSLAGANGGAIGFSASASVTSGSSWLSVTPTAGVTPAQLTISANAAGLAEGNYTGTVQVTDTGGASISLDVVLQVTPGPPVINSLSPAVVQAGAFDTVFTLTGSGFTPAVQVMAVYAGFGFPSVITPTTFVDAHTVKVTIPAFLLWQPGRIELEVANAAAGPWTTAAVTIR